MTKHEELLREGPRNAPEPETAEQRSRRKRIEAAAGGAVVVGGGVLAKFGALTKFFLWIIAWHGVVDLWRIGGWIALLAVALVALVLIVRSHGREENAMATSAEDVDHIHAHAPQIGISALDADPEAELRAARAEADRQHTRDLWRGV